MSRFTDVPIPARMEHLPRDRRGYPIPVMVLVDENGHPHFTVNDYTKMHELVRQDCCHICGHKLDRVRWFVGGPFSAYYGPMGAYNDGPLHRQCLHYAMQVCPHLALPNYSGRIEMKTIEQKPDGAVRLLVSTTMMPDRPEVFVAVMALPSHVRFGLSRATGWFMFKVRRPYRNIEYWRHGRRLDAAEAQPIIRAALAKGVPADIQREAKHFVSGV